MTMDKQNILALYDDILEKTTKMKLAARKKKWDEFALLENSCEGKLEEIKSSLEHTQLSREEYAQKLERLKLILANDKEIRDSIVYR